MQTAIVAADRLGEILDLEPERTLDEATSNLDSITERAIQETIDEYAKDMTTIIIAHRLSTIKRCDLIYVIEKRKIIEAGNHEQLIGFDGMYAKLWGQQV